MPTHLIHLSLHQGSTHSMPQTSMILNNTIFQGCNNEQQKIAIQFVNSVYNYAKTLYLTLYLNISIKHLWQWCHFCSVQVFSHE